MEERCTAIVLAAGSGSRMKSSTAKQFMLLKGKPLIWYSLNTIEESEIIDECILVTGEEDIEYVKKEIVAKYSFRKVRLVVAGGSERWESVANAMEALNKDSMYSDGYVFVHDGARPFLTKDILADTYADATKYGACVAAVPSKDTIKIADSDGFAIQTPNRKTVWAVQTPQVFEKKLIVNAYRELKRRAAEVGKENITVTDDASVVELFTDWPVKLTLSDYKNLKITTPEDMKIAESFLEEK